MRPGRRHRRRERGSAMLITLVIVAALLAGGSVLVSMQLSSNRATDLTRSGLAALHCAEGGLAEAHAAVAVNSTDWDAWLGTGTEPTWLNSIDHDLDNDGAADFIITLKDNDDEIAPTANNASDDIDSRVWIISTCLKYPDTPKQVSELVSLGATGRCYDSQKNGCGGNNSKGTP